MSTRYQRILSAEPRLGTVQRELESLLQLVELESEGQAVQITGFRLKQLPAWRSVSGATPLDALGALSGACNCRCVFCFERGHPFPQDRSILSLEEARARLKYYDPACGAALFPSNRVFKEPFVNPEALTILKEARQRSADEVFWLTSNGAFFTEDVVRQVAELRPVVVKLSLNSASPEIRQQLMGGDNRPEVAIQAPVYLQRYEIPFIGSIVAWPLVMPDDLVRSLHYLDQYEPYALRVRLPVYHRYLHPTPPFADDLWERAIDLCRQVRPQLESPLYVEPHHYWFDPIVPNVDGVIRHSPAAEAKIEPGDRILEIDGEPVLTRCQALGLLAQAHSERRSPVALCVQHAGSDDRETVALAMGTAHYPYSPEVYAPGERYGLLLLDDFRIQYVAQIAGLVAAYDSQRALAFSSPAIAPLARMMAREIPPYRDFFQDRQLAIETLEETEVGGNYRLMDGRLVADLIAQIERSSARLGYDPDLIMIPKAFGNPWGIDYFQVSYKEIERRFDVPVELIDWPILYGRDI